MAAGGAWEIDESRLFGANLTDLESSNASGAFLASREIQAFVEDRPHRTAGRRIRG